MSLPRYKSAWRKRGGRCSSSPWNEPGERWVTSTTIRQGTLTCCSRIPHLDSRYSFVSNLKEKEDTRSCRGPTGQVARGRSASGICWSPDRRAQMVTLPKLNRVPSLHNHLHHSTIHPSSTHLTHGPGTILRTKDSKEDMAITVMRRHGSHAGLYLGGFTGSG